MLHKSPLLLFKTGFNQFSDTVSEQRLNQQSKSNAEWYLDTEKQYCEVTSFIYMHDRNADLEIYHPPWMLMITVLLLLMANGLYYEYIGFLIISEN